MNTAKEVTAAVKRAAKIVQAAGIKAPKEKTVRVLCYVPVEVKKMVQNRRANDPRPSPPSENSCYLEMLRDGMSELRKMPTLATTGIFRIAKDNRQYFAPVGIRMPATMHRELKAAARKVPQFTGPEREPINYRFIDLVACLLTRSVSGFQIKNI